MAKKKNDIVRSGVIEHQIRSGSVTRKHIKKVLESCNVFDYQIRKTKDGTYIASPGLHSPAKGFLELQQ